MAHSEEGLRFRFMVRFAHSEEGNKACFWPVAAFFGLVGRRSALFLSLYQIRQTKDVKSITQGGR
jgi:hypothetical protein